MKAVIQRVKAASVTVNNEVISQIAQGLLVLVGVTHNDTINEADFLAQKIINMRIFTDADDKLNLSIQDIQGELLIVSQFTLYAEAEKGNRPSFSKAANPSLALPIYEHFITKLRSSGLKVLTGMFGADMQVSLVNDGPVTIILERSNS